MFYCLVTQVIFFYEAACNDTSAVFGERAGQQQTVDTALLRTPCMHTYVVELRLLLMYTTPSR